MQNMPSILTPDFGLLFWMLLAFLVVFFLLKKYAFGAITGAVEERKNFIDESIKNAREANEKLANIKAESEKILMEARAKQADIIKEAMATRDNIIKASQVKAQTEGAKILEEAKAQIQVEKENALRDIRSQVADLSLQVAEKVVRRQIETDKEQELYIERLLDEVAKA
ncbi:ATP synthase F0 subunit B [Pseudoprevotella muciniphila]|uniref:ATP synthase subunit b n=1 Tax=Pseudoprevotella muciniphila TaxID=2133944 RepID=A0A5P8E4H7_9BACT|nr:F0F1 ATP synthase subunit B [Pseudoprevotella muciniphila]QFQ11836.1 ATP synthase F0 subunit B [Pseudoprevotella muciniphila]